MTSVPSRYSIPTTRFRTEIEVDRSRFITTVQEVTSPAEAQAFVAAIKAEFPDANHNGWAYLVGPPGSSDQIGLSDDGEPHGVAGRPILTTLQHSGLGDTALVVSRYFGGIKLGKGGWSRPTPPPPRAPSNSCRAACALPGSKSGRASTILC